jgi:hypothetical protein
MRRVSLLFVSLAVVLIAAPALAGNSWNGYHWADGSDDPHDGDITLTLVNDLTAYSTTLYSAVKSDWASNKGPVSFVEATSSSRPAACDNNNSEPAGDEIAGEIHVCNDYYGTNGWLGLARIWLASDGHIDAGVALMNDSYMLANGSAYNDEVAQRHVLCQEVGHTLGLGHVSGPKKQSCMNDRWGLTNPDFQSPNPHDYNTLIEIYGAPDSGGSEGGNAKPCNPNRKNCPANGSNVDVVPRPGGGWIITFTIPPGRSSL